MAAPDYNQIIDPAIRGPHDGAMPPPPVPSAKSLRGQGGPHIARRGTRRDARASSIASIHSVPVTDAFSSQPEPQGMCGCPTHCTFILQDIDQSVQVLRLSLRWEPRHPHALHPSSPLRPLTRLAAGQPWPSS
jgi:hypothetical protein